MLNYNPLIILGLTTTVLVSAPLAVHAESRVYREIGGKESIRFDPNALTVLESLGLSLGESESTIEPDPGFTYGLALLPPSSDPNVLGTDFQFRYDPETKVYIPLGEIERFSGRVAFNVDTSKLALPSQRVDFNGFAIDFDSGFNFYVESNGLRLFDVESSGSPTFDLNTNTWTLQNIDLLASQDFSDLLVAAGASTPIAGLKLGEAQGERAFIDVAATQVPEPGSTLAILTAASAALAVGKRRNRSTL